MDKKVSQIRNIVKENWIENLSDTNLPEHVKIVLSLGPNFGYSHEYKNLPIIETIANIDSALFNNPKASEIRNEITNISTNFLNYYKQAENSDKLLNQFIRQTKKFLNDNKQIVIIKADKGNKTVVSVYDPTMK